MNTDTITIVDPDLKDRKTGLVVFGIFEILLGALCVLAVLLMILGMLISSSCQKDAGVSMDFGTMLPSLLIYVLLAVWFIWLGIGSIQARRWARALLLISSWFWLISGLVGMVFMVVFLSGIYDQAGKNGEMPWQVAAIIKCVSYGLIFILYVIIPGVAILFYGSRHVKATCERRDPRVRWTDKCPLPVLAASLIAGLWAFGLLSMGFYWWAVPFFGVILSGSAGAVVVLVGSALFGYAAWGMYRLRVSAWWCAVLLIVAWGISGCITFSRLGLIELYEKMNFPAQQLEIMKQLTLPQPPWLALFCGSWAVIALVYLVYTRKYFMPDAE